MCHQRKPHTPKPWAAMLQMVARLDIADSMNVEGRIVTRTSP